MKKLMLLLFVGICATAYAEKKPSIQDIQVNEACTPSRPVRPRFETPTKTEGEIDLINKTVNVDMNYYMGDLTIKITDPTGEPVYETTADSDVVASVSAPMPEAGDYRLVIEGEEYQAEGTFSVE